MTTNWTEIHAKLRTARERDIRRSRSRYRWLLFLAHPVSVAVIAALLLTVVGRYAWQTSAAIALVIVGATVAILAREYAAEPPFRPFTIRIDPAWSLIAREIAHLEESDPLYVDIVTLQPLVVTAITPTLWYVHSHDKFATRLEISNRIRVHGSQFGYYLDQTIGGYEFGVITPESSRDSVVAGDEADHVPIGTLPYEELAGYYRHLFLPASAEASRAARVRYGWTEEKISSELPRETDAIAMSNKYLWVTHRLV